MQNYAAGKQRAHEYKEDAETNMTDDNKVLTICINEKSDMMQQAKREKK